MIEKTQFVVEIHGMDTKSSERTIKKTFDHHLICDISSHRYNYGDLGSYTLNVVVGL